MNHWRIQAGALLVLSLFLVVCGRSLAHTPAYAMAGKPTATPAAARPTAPPNAAAAQPLTTTSAISNPATASSLTTASVISNPAAASPLTTTNAISNPAAASPLTTTSAISGTATPAPVSKPATAKPAPTEPLTQTVAAGSPVGGNAALAAQGRALYLQLYCGVCHTQPAAGTNGKFGPTHDHIGSTAALRVQDPNYRGEAHTAAEYLRESITIPKAFLVPGFANTPHPMPSYAHLAPADVDALAYFLLQQK